jgi:tetratricopeptide (TPR) repeat protein
LIAAASIAAALATAPEIAAAAGAGMPSAGGDTRAQSAPTQQKSHAEKKPPGNRSSIDDFIAGYKAAYAMIYERGDYEKAIMALHALDNADVANLIGYANRKLGRYDDAKIWYERSLAADPNHAVIWSYYGMWQAEQGNLLKAKDDLERVRLICGTNCDRTGCSRT